MRPFRRGWFAAAAAFTIAVLAAQLAWAQAGTGGVSGTVKDAQGAVVPGATVTATNQSLGTRRTTTSNAEGAYSIPGLSPGDYTLKVELTGFRTFVHEKVTLRVDSMTTVDAVLSLGSLSETVTVSEATPIVNTTDASVGNTMSHETIERLPVEGRNVVHLLSLQPGAVFIPTTNANTTDPRYGAVAGSRADQQNVTLDGIDVNDAQLQAAYTSAVRMTQEALQEFKVSTSNYGADVGRSSGAQVSLVTRSGTNRFDGSAYGFVRRTQTSTNEYFLKLSQLLAGKPNEPPKLDKNIFGGALGGPVRRNRTFFFGNYEGLQENSERPVTRAVPSDSLRDGVLMYLCANAGDCPGGSVQGFSSSHPVKAGWYGLSPAQVAAIDPLGIGPNPAASAYFKQYPSPNAPGLDGANIMDFLFSAPIENRFHTFIGRLDHKLAANHTLFARGNFQDDTINTAPQFPGQDPARQTLNNNNGFAIGYDAALSPSLVNSLRYGITKIDTSSVGQLKSNYVSFRFIDPLVPTTDTTTRETPTQNIVDDLSWLRGKHTLKAGTNIRFTRIPTSRNTGSFLNTSINPSWVTGSGRRYRPGAPTCTTPGCFGVPVVASNFTAGFGDPWLDLLGVLSQANLNANYDKTGKQLPIGEPVRRKFASDEYEWYAQDSWRIGSTLTLNGGIRYSLYSPPYEVNGLQVAPNVSMGQWFADRAAGMLKGVPSNKSPLVTFDLAGPKNGKKGFYDWDKNNWAPRISAAWTPHPEHGLFAWLTGKDRTVIRGGYSKVFDRIGQGIATNFDSGFAFGMATSISSPFGTANETTPGVRFVDISTMPPTMPAAPPGGFPQTPPLHAGIITQSIDDTLKTPSAHMINLLVSREIGGSFAIEGGYVGRFGRDLLIRRDLAMPLDLVDTKSGVGYFAAAQALIKAAQAAGISPNASLSAYAGLAKIPYWENLFPDAATSTASATAVMAQLFNSNTPDYTSAIYSADEFCDPACSIYGPFAYWAEQYDSLAALSSVGRSNYNSMVLTLHKRHTMGLQFDINYTLSHSQDMGSNVERGTAFSTYGAGGYSGFLINSFDPELNYGTSDFDVRHQVNANAIYDLPFGQGRRFGGHSGGFTNHVIGDWSIAGLMRWTSGFPFNVQNCRSCWATNWNLQGNAELVTPGVLPETGLTKNIVDNRPSPFKDPVAAAKLFRYDLPGEAGIRNVLRGDGYFTIDTSVSKSWRVVSDNRIRFRWDVFNVTNTAKFNVGDATMTPDRTGFGRYNSTLAACDAQAGRCMQFALRYEF